MSRNRVFVEVDEAGNVARIFNRMNGIYDIPRERLREIPRKDATESVRRQIYARSGGLCEYCGKPITWNFHCHEVVPRSKGGQMSLENSVAICANCHIGPSGEHSDRLPRFGETKCS